MNASFNEVVAWLDEVSAKKSVPLKFSTREAFIRILEHCEKNGAYDKVKKMPYADDLTYFFMATEFGIHKNLLLQAVKSLCACGVLEREKIKGQSGKGFSSYRYYVNCPFYERRKT